MSSRANLIRTVGLVTNQNELDAPEGSLREAINVNINERGVITPRRGFAEYGNPTDLLTEKRVEQLFEYRDRVFRHYQNIIEHETETQQFKPVSGLFQPVRSGYRIKTRTSKGNMYVTTNEGVKRLSATGSSELNSTSPTLTSENAGVPRASYLEGEPVDQLGGFLPAQSKVAYRFLFGKKDVNNNLLLGTASSRAVVTNDNARAVTFFQQTIQFQNETAPHIVNGDYIVINTKSRKLTFYFDTNGSATRPFDANTIGSTFIKVDVQGAANNDVAAAGILANEIALNVPEFNTPTLSPADTIVLESNEEGSIAPAITNVPTKFVVNTVQAGSVVEGSPAVVSLDLIIPSELDDTYFLQVYRSGIITATEGLLLDDIDPGDELNLVIEEPLTPAIVSAGVFTLIDQTPDGFRASGVPLYSNEVSGEGILQSNDRPPIALDIDLFRGSMFYANTRSMHRLQIDLISIDDFIAGQTFISISNSQVTRFYTSATIEDFNTPEGGDFKLSTSLSPAVQIDQTARSIVKTINLDQNSPVNAFYLTGADDLPGKILLESKSLLDDPFYVSIDSGYDLYVGSVSYTVGNRVRFNNLDYICIQNTTGINDGSEDPSGTELDNAFWEFFDISQEFSPRVSRSIKMQRLRGESLGETAVITIEDHGYTTGTKLYISYLNDGDIDAPPSFRGLFEIEVIDADNFRIETPMAPTVDSSGANPFLLQFSTVHAGSTVSDNLKSPNRIYFSKNNEPEAVPFSNFIDIGSSNREIKRILALRDNLFVMKDDGIFIVSGTTAPDFSVRLLDNARIIAHDSAVVLNNQIFVLTDQGITTITDSGAAIISRGIENLITEITAKIPNFDVNTFGISYENDRSYLMFCPKLATDTTATIAFRYHIFERVWTQWEYDATCGVVALRDNKMYLGSGTRNFVTQERKNFDTSDYADRDFTFNIINNGVAGTTIVPNTLVGLQVGDAIVQTQKVSFIYFNNRILKRLDTFDFIIPKPIGSTFFDSFGIAPGENIANKIQLLNDYLSNLDPVFTPKTITDINFREQMELLVDELNSVNSPSGLKNYKKPRDVQYETYITEVDKIDSNIKVAVERPFFQGEVTVFKHYRKVVEYNPWHFGDPSATKQIREASLMFDQNNFNDAVMNFSSDIDQSRTPVPFKGKGKSYWGDLPWGDPDHFWGGNGNDVPFRTVTPPSKQRCRYLTIGFQHRNAREYFRLVGISAVVRAVSSRGYL